MNDEFLNLKDQANLGLINDYLATVDVHGTLLEVSEHLDHNIIVSVLPEGSPVNIMYVPLPENHFEEIRLMQLYGILLAEIDPGKKADLLTLLNEINSVCPVGSFSFNKMGELGFRYIFPVQRFEIPSKVSFLELFTVFKNSLLTYRDVLVDVDSGELSLADALNSLVDDNN